MTWRALTISPYAKIFINRPNLTAKEVEAGILGRAAQVDSFKTGVESAYGVCNQRLKL